MKTIEAYALSCGLKIGEPFILDKFFPLDFEKYIVIHPFSTPAKSYDYWIDVINIIKPALDKASIQIIQLGATGERSLPGCANLQGKTTLNQSAYIVKGALCLVGPDGFFSYVAGHYDVKSVTLYSSSNPENTETYWGHGKNRISITGRRDMVKASYSTEETPKTINNIYPEVIAKAICSLLEIDLEYPFHTVHIGKDYLKEHLTVFPCSSFVQHAQDSSPELRMDLHFDENVLAQQLEQNKCVIVSDRPINLDLLKKYKPQIAAFVYLLKESDHPAFVKDLKKLGLNLFCFTHLSETEFEHKKINYYDLIKINVVPSPDARLATQIKDKGVPLFYMSRQNIFSDGKVFNSQAAFSEKISAQNQITPVIDSPQFWRQLDDFRILKRSA